MNNKDVKVVFMGTPEFAVPSLNAIINEGYNVVAVITSPDKGAGRGRKTKVSAIKSYALDKGLKILQPENLKDPQFILQLKALNPDLQVVIAFRMLPKVVWSIPKYGTFNLHASLLPQYRGAAPINHAILNGEKKTGLTTFLIDEKIDTGEIIDQIEVDIFENESFGELHDKLKEIGAGFILESIGKVMSPNYQFLNQENLARHEIKLKKAPKISKVFCQINWEQQAHKVYNFIRALSPYPTAYSYLNNNEKELVLIKLFVVQEITLKHKYKIGSVITDNKSFVHVAVLNGFISIIELQLTGKRRMHIRDFLNGFSISSSAKFETN